MLLLLVLALAVPAFAQPTPVIGYLGLESAERYAAQLGAFRRGLEELNFVEGRNVSVEYRWAGGDAAKLPELAADLVGRKVNVLVAPGSVPAALAAKKATSTIPIVFLVGVDPVALGLVRGMSHPGGNATGVTSLSSETGPKRLQLLRELVPGMKSFAVLINPRNPRTSEGIVNDLQVAAHAQRLQFQAVSAATEQDLAVTFENLERERVGGLISYAGSIEESHRIVGVYTGRLLRGERPGDLPVQQPSKMNLSINAKTAKALGLDIPSSMRYRADRVIE